MNLHTVLIMGISSWLAFSPAHAEPLRDAKLLKSQLEMIEAYRLVEVSSVSDAIEQLTHKRSYMTSKIHAVSAGKFAGFAVTVHLISQEGSAASDTLPMQEAIDAGGKDSVYVMSIDSGDNIAGIGGLMATAMHSRQFAGAVIDGSVRDVDYLRKIQFPVYAKGSAPGTSVGHYRAQNGVPIVCDGISIAPGDIIVGDNDGVVVIPLDLAPSILIKAQQLDQTEHSMYGFIEKTRSLKEAVSNFGRL